MTVDEKKRFLNRAFNLNRHINSAIREQEEIKIMFDKCVRCTANYQNDGSQNGSHSNGTENSIINYISKIEEYRNQLDSEVDLLVDTKQDIKQAINTLTDETEKAVLLYRYINYMKWEEIAVEMHFDIRWIYQLHKRAIQNIKIVQ